MSHKFLVFLFLSVLISVPSTIHGHKILVMVPLYGKSHWNYMTVFVQDLLNRGHEITCITNMAMPDPKPKNYTEILIDPPYLRQNLVKQEDIFEWSSKSMLFTVMPRSVEFIRNSCKHSFENEQLQKFIHSENHHYDLIVTEAVWTEAFLIFGHKFKAPTVAISPYGVDEHFDHYMGIIPPLSHVSSIMLPYSDSMNFIERWYNAFYAAFGWYNNQLLHNPMQEQLINEYFSHLAPLPTIEELRKNISIVFVNAHSSITYPRPKMPGMVYIGGAHIKPPKALPNDLQRFIDESKHGVIYFSLGSAVNTSKLPAEKLDMFLDTFRQLKQRVIWKFEDESIQNVPSNVLIRKWLPQTDILAHPNIVLFISQGGMFSNFEAVKYGIQMLVIPLVSDQFRNAHLIQSQGYGKHMDLREMTHESFHGTLKEMLTDNKYALRAKEVSAIFNDNLKHPMDEFNWWIEHVIKFRGAKHLRSQAAADMSIFVYLSLDVILANLIVIMIIVFSIYFVIKRLCCKLKTMDKEKKKKKL